MGAPVDCEVFGCPNPYVVNNRYQWSKTASDPDGGAFSDFLAKLNGLSGGSGCLANHCDWRLPIIGELRTILIGPDAGPGQATTCSAAPCIDPGFAALGGPTASSSYWSGSTFAAVSVNGWFAGFGNGGVAVLGKTNYTYVRAVRGGSCS